MKAIHLLIGLQNVLFFVNNFQIGFGVQRLKDNSYKKNTFLTQEFKCDNVTENWFKDAVIDNFSSIQEQKKWKGKGQRYYLNKQFWGGPGYPIFVFIGGEGQEKCTRLTAKSHLFAQAKKYNALLIDVEHRFYGESYPTLDMSTKNIRYLSSEQALADLARIIGFIKRDLNTTESKVITVGGSYPGNLAAWFRLKYPSVTDGSIASSAPLMAKTNFYEYMEVVGESIKYFSGESCYNSFSDASHILSKLLENPKQGWKKVEDDFKLCYPLSSNDDISIFLSDMMGNIQGTVQYNNEKFGVMNITDICKVMQEEKMNPYENFVKLSAMYRNATGQTCENARWKDSISKLSDPKKDPENNGRPWTFQTCNEFGYFQTTISKSHPFQDWTKWLDLEFYLKICKQAFDLTSEPMVDWINEVYGDVRISGTNIIFPSGTIDPWHVLGITNSTTLNNHSLKSVFILGTAHCHDLYKEANSDPSSLINARKIITDTLESWLK